MPTARLVDRIPTALLRSRAEGPFADVALIIRLVAGVAMIGFGFGKFTDYGAEVHEFRHYGLPLPHLAVVMAGVVEVVGGLLLALGLFTRLAAGVLGSGRLGLDQRLVSGRGRRDTR